MKTRPEVTLDDLVAMNPDQLMELYKSGRTPEVAELDGRLRGRMLAVPRAQEAHVARWLRALAGTLWQGKTFEHHDAMQDAGYLDWVTDKGATAFRRQHDPASLRQRLFGSRAEILQIQTRVRPHRGWNVSAILLGPK